MGSILRNSGRGFHFYYWGGRRLQSRRLAELGNASLQCLDRNGKLVQLAFHRQLPLRHSLNQI
jgi:hypothetical protein